MDLQTGKRRWGWQRWAWYNWNRSSLLTAFHLLRCRSGSATFLSDCCQYWGPDVRLIYRHYATLYFIFAVDEAESELGILDLIQVFVEALDKCFENVCELDLIFHIDKSEREHTHARIHTTARADIRLHRSAVAGTRFDSRNECSRGAILLSVLTRLLAALFRLQPLRSVVSAGFTSSSTRL